MATVKNKGGRPPRFATEQALANALLEYFGEVDKKKHMPNKAGLCLKLGITRETYNQYKSKYPDAIKGAEYAIEQAWVQRLGGANATGAIFYLKAAMGWQDKQEVDLTSGGEKLNIMWGTPKK
jgi:hypothetical protein